MFRVRFWACLAGLAALGLAGCGGGGASNDLAPSNDSNRAASGLTPVLISFGEAPGAAEEALVTQHGGKLKYHYTLVHGFAASLPESAIDGLRRNPKIASIDPDVTVHKTDAELDNTWGVKRIGAGTAHDGGNKGAGIKVAVIDTGIDYNHPELAANYQGGYDFVNNDADPLDDEGHGTHVAGTVAAADDGLGVVGVAPDAQLYALKVLNNAGSGSFSDIIAAVQWCVDNGIQVTNNSYGSSQNPGSLVQQAFDAAQTAGIISVAAAGNSGNPGGKGDNVGYPARYASVIAVAATNSSDSRASFSSTGPAVELSAPGASITSCKLGGGYISYSGTSMASPHVAGAAALCLAGGITDPRTALSSTALDLGAGGRDERYGFGLIDVAAALGFSGGGGSSGGTLEVAVTVDPGPYANRETVTMTALVTDGASPVAGANVSFVVTSPKGSILTATATTGVDGTATVSYKVNSKRDGAGNATVVATASKANYTTGSSDPAQFVIQ